MHLIYFDENKYSEQNPFFFMGGVLLKDAQIELLEKLLIKIQYDFFGTSLLNKNTELHGVDIFHGKNAYKTKKLYEHCHYEPIKWHEQKAKKLWEAIKTGTDFSMQRWPKQKWSDQSRLGESSLIGTS